MSLIILSVVLFLTQCSKNLNLCVGFVPKLSDINDFTEIRNRKKLIEAIMPNQKHIKFSSFTFLEWDYQVIKQLKKQITWHLPENNQFNINVLEILRYRGILCKGKLTLDENEKDRFLRQVIISQLLYNYDQESFSEPYGCMTYNLSNDYIQLRENTKEYPINATENGLVIFAIKSVIGTFERDCEESKKVCFHQKFAKKSTLTRKYEVFKLITDAVHSLHKQGLTHNGICPENIGVQDYFMNQIKLFELEWVAYEGDRVFGFQISYSDLERLKGFKKAKMKGIVSQGFDVAEFEYDVWSLGVLFFTLMSENHKLEEIDFLEDPELAVSQVREIIMVWIEQNQVHNQCYLYNGECVCVKDLLSGMLAIKRRDRIQNVGLISKSLTIIIFGKPLSSNQTSSFWFFLGFHCKKLF